MLELYRASAGSGKTYTLAKKYIWYYLTIQPEGGQARLRTEAELADSARHILAVTFTNKATNEMQLRIVGALNDLATIRTKRIITEDGQIKEVLPDYMKDFSEELGVSIEEIARISGIGLSILLENYSDFNVSTIDSFFQTVLRTFAYESDLNDSYQVELDTEFLSQLGVDATLEEIDSNDKDSNTKFWIRTLMDRTEGRSWNIFTRNAGSSRGYNTENPYKEFIDSVKKMENEEYKYIREDLEDYFAKHGDDLVDLYKTLQKKYETPAKEAFKRMRRKVKEAYSSLPIDILESSSRSDLGKIPLYYRRLSGQDGTVKLKWSTPLSYSKFPEFNSAILERKSWKMWSADNPSDSWETEQQLEDVQSAVAEWTAITGTKEFRHWMLYASRLPYYALFSIVSRKRQEYLDENNAVELAETSMILRNVIGDNDTPFIYERLGTRLNHFLIDEFQDTSRMQWHNLSPLLRESLSRGNGNLIIGDAKQSIYRFRNADPSLITTEVPETFGTRVQEKGDDPSENTNYRSDLRIVQFNNSFFRYLVETLDKERGAEEAGKRISYRKLYNNVMQLPNKRAEAGFIEIVCPDDKKDDAGVSAIPGLIRRLMKRGYRQSEIAVLVSRHTEGEMVIEAITGSNAEPENSDEPIRFVSEQSLKVASSKAVKIITGVLSNMARGSNPEIRSGEDRRKKGVGNWHELASDFKYFSLNHPGLDNARLLDAYIESGANFNALSELLSELQSFAIPGVVEAVSATFLTDELRESDAVYIAAFQDLVLEYCENHPTDIGSFMKWWERRSRSASIASPEDSDSVQVITVHKAKGLQYECVILPFSNWNFGDGSSSHSEWRWVHPEVISHPEIPLPPYIPVETTSELEDTTHADLLETYYDQVSMDNLNAAYVAFTRAKKEMYIFSEMYSKKKEYGMGRYLTDFIQQLATCKSPDSTPETSKGILELPANEVNIEKKEPFIATVGRPAEEIGKDRKASHILIPLSRYNSVKSPSFLKYRAEEASALAGNEDESEEEFQLDIRDEGTLKHAVLEYIKTADDLPHAIRHLQLQGILPDALARTIEEELAEALSRPEVTRWFDGSARVMNERPVLKRGFVTRRPDRLLIYPDGSAVVVDYKFGKIPNDNKHRRQIERYVRLLKETGQFKSVSGYLWYVNERVIVPV
ncbi:MAG: UvrD-helicase domain-containing protein [Muribaculaceae bacterium]|nr:UvrD-helicase domain-containing protein [Muribaculaceae bacterium]